MPIECYKRGNWWWIKGKIDQIPSSQYYRQSLEVPSGLPKKEAEEIATLFQQKQIRNHLLSEYGAADKILTFADAVLLYPANQTDAGYLSKVLPHISERPVSELTPQEIRNLGPVIYPMCSTDTWTRQVVTPIRSVINNAHDLGKCPPIRVKAYPARERINQDRLRNKASRVPKVPADIEWLTKFRAAVSPRLAALSIFMYTTGRRIGQSLQINDTSALDLQNYRLLVPGAKGHEDEWIDLIPEVAIELSLITPRHGLLFGYKNRHSVYGPWNTGCKRAGIAKIMPHAAGRHGFGTETLVRLGLDPKTAANAGAWADPNVPLKTYSHSSNSREIVNTAMRTKLVQSIYKGDGKRLKFKR